MLNTSNLIVRLLRSLHCLETIPLLFRRSHPYFCMTF